MQFSEMHFSEEASRSLSQMKGRTGLTPNILARIGFCLSLENPTPPDPAEYEGAGHISIKRHVLTGPYDALFEAMLKERCYQDEVCDEQMPNQFKAHMNRGVLLLHKRLKNVDDLLLTLPASWR
jgi:DNA sulfur modification protein DndE